MAFENLSDKLQEVFKGFRSKGTLTEKDLKDGLREVKLALLEADVNFKVVREFVARGCYQCRKGKDLSQYHIFGRFHCTSLLGEYKLEKAMTRGHT